MTVNAKVVGAPAGIIPTSDYELFVDQPAPYGGGSPRYHLRWSHLLSRWNDVDAGNTQALIPMGVGGDPAPESPMTVSLKVTHAGKSPVVAHYVRWAIVTQESPPEWDWRTPVSRDVIADALIRANYQQLVEQYNETLDVLGQAQIALENLTDVTVTSETSKAITLRFDSDPLAAVGLSATLSELQTDVLALDARMDAAESQLVSLTPRVDATEDAISPLEADLITLSGDVADLQAVPAEVKVGTIILWGKTAPPTGWLACDGQQVGRSVYAALFAEIGTNFGVGDNSTTFNLPDLRGRVPIGAGTGSGLTTRALGQTGGAETHTLTVAEMPEHNHGIDEPAAGEPGLILRSIVGQTTTVNTGDSAQSGTEPQVGYGDPGEPDPMTGIPLEGGGNPHNNMQPFVVLQYIIRAQ
ncbi:phage tail protein [Deinococcus misasensis]|uniref:phage tail protein n=1 Tax=Deinococcus misasensis TaxID=392413 RepID=UPI000A039BE3|nr:tail fiber protein [Deinococcus misasensis]